MIFFLLACSDAPENFDYIGPEGGELVSAGVTIDVPAGAVDEPTLLRVVDLGIEPPEPYEGLSSVYGFEPAGLVFNEPVRVSIPYREHALPQLYWSDGGDYERLRNVDFSQGQATVTLDHFSRGFVAITPMETFETVYQPAPVDLLFAVDSSCSMGEFQQRLGEHGPSLLQHLDDAGIDYHIGVISLDMHDYMNGQGKLRSIGGQSYIEPSTADPLHTFTLLANVGTTGWFRQEGRAAAYTMVEIKRHVPRNEGFLRSDATLDIVFVSDDTEASGEQPLRHGEFVSWLGLHDEPGMARVHAITQQEGDLCSPQGAPGVAYADYANRTGGELVDLCGDDWSGSLMNIVDRRQVGGAVELPVEPAEIVSVRVEGDAPRELQSGDFTIEGALLRFAPDAAPRTGERVVVDYRP